jgi:hypothetical protein
MGVCTFSGKISCGGDGFALVFQNVANNVVGLAGGGLGYASIQGAVAIEFDAVQNPDKNDPSTEIERHISLIPSPRSSLNLISFFVLI